MGKSGRWKDACVYDIDVIGVGLVASIDEASYSRETGESSFDPYSSDLLVAACSH